MLGRWRRRAGVGRRSQRDTHRLRSGPSGDSSLGTSMSETLDVRFKSLTVVGLLDDDNGEVRNDNGAGRVPADDFIRPGARG